ncbi:hypothetical protein E5163_07475 [Marinicauda algicola]|uniref:Uncharacterized protein n=1 Tax=Marinicauda algicola TaxID=2029849 RepID=A0A4S2H0G0_9PROT|nr:hypothetical protein [Marinicauda algicola]TGY88966.1 hypothetical protein E5163_07475 [Marinicauda algicola]
MSALPESAQIVILALAASLALGLPVRLVGLTATFRGIGIALGWARRRKFTVLAIGLAGAAAGLWSFEEVRDLVFSLI